VFETVEDLTSAVTSVLSPNGPLGTLAQSLTDALDSVWAEFFGAAALPGGTNWNAYSHEQLHGMLWQEADVGDVSTVAAEWGRHSTELTGYADALRTESANLRANWQGRASELAADRLAELSDRIWNAGARAGTVQKAAAEAGEALAHARNTMPDPPPDPMTLMSSSVGAGPMNPVAAVLVGGARLFTADAVAGMSKAEAVRVMQQYESSLAASANQVVPTQTNPAPRSYDVDGIGTTTAAAATGGGAFGGGSSGGGGGVPWSRLVGGGGVPGAGGSVGAGPVPGMGLPVVPGAAGADAAARRGMGPAGFFPPMGQRSGEDEEKTRRSTLPTVDNGIFAVTERTSHPVIGGVTDEERDIGLQ
jgi:hypothetical protein